MSDLALADFVELVAPRMRRVSRNVLVFHSVFFVIVAPRMRRVSRNQLYHLESNNHLVAPRMRRVSRNVRAADIIANRIVAPRMRRVSRNHIGLLPIGLLHLSLIHISMCIRDSVYTLSAGEYASALETVGLDSYIGFCHTLRSGRISLAYDLVEEARCLAERFTLTLFNLQILGEKDFEKHISGAVSYTHLFRILPTGILLKLLKMIYG